MKGSLWELTAAELLARTASARPTPGGGSVAALTGALGLGLVVMALEITAGRKDALPGLDELCSHCRELLDRLRAHPDRDVAAFEGYMAALGLPKSSEGEKAARRVALQEAARTASEAPLAAARDLLAALILSQRAAGLAHRNVVSDVGAGAELLLGALRASLLNVDVNAGSLSPEEAARLLAARLDLQRRAEAVHQAVAAQVGERLRPPSL